MTTLPSLVLQTSLTLNEITFEIYAHRALCDEEVMRAVAFYIIEHRRLVKGVTYKVFTTLGEEGEAGLRVERASE
jgi:hypothetical protein